MKLMNELLCAALLCALAGPALGKENAGTTAPGPQSAQEQRLNREQALLHKARGDGYVAKGDFRKAAEEFLLALSRDRSAFSEEDQVRMAVILSWAEKPLDAIALLQPIVRRSPKNLDARLQLARVLSWTGRLGEAEAEADAALSLAPNSAEALLVKANILRWNGQPEKAATYYRKILGVNEDFDARAGLAYSELAAGDRLKAEEDAGLLKPGSADQALERDRLNKAIRGSNPPSRAASISRYWDSDGNRVDAYGLSSGFLIGGARSDIAYRQVNAFDRPGSASAEVASLKTYLKQGSIGAGGGVGFTHAGQGQAPFVATGQVRADTGIQGWLVGTAASKNVLTDTAQLIRNKIIQKSGEVFASREFLSRYTVAGSFSHSEYSDDNRAQDWIFRLNHTVSYDNPGVLLGYKLRYLDFSRQSGGGYFDPERFTSQELRAEVHAEAGRYHGMFEPVLGYQEFLRFGVWNHQFVYSARATAGYMLRKQLSLDLLAESGKNNSGALSVYRYSVAEIRLTRTF